MFEAFIQHLITHQIPEYTIVVLLYLPIVASLVTLARYIFGWKSLTIYSSVLLTFAIYDLSRNPAGDINIVRGLIQGGFVVLTTTFVALILQSITRELRMHYLARVSVIVSTITIAIFSILYAATVFQNDTFAEFNPIAILIILLVIDIFIRSSIRKGWQKAILYVVGTIVLSYVIFLGIAQESFKNFVLAHPEITLYLIVFNLVVGRWKGLRVSEYFRFKDLLTSEPYDSEHTKE